MRHEPNSGYTGLKHHAKVHSFRIVTAIVAWLAIGLAFYYRPEVIQWGLRTSTRSLETVGDALPYPWGARAEIVLRELGGSIWLQITAVILLVRIIFWAVAAVWRFRRRYR